MLQGGDINKIKPSSNFSLAFNTMELYMCICLTCCIKLQLPAISFLPVWYTIVDFSLFLQVLGKFHPHGDTAVYDSLVRMAQVKYYGCYLINEPVHFLSVYRRDIK